MATGATTAPSAPAVAPAQSSGWGWNGNTVKKVGVGLLNAATGIPDMVNDVKTLTSRNASGWDRFGAGVNFVFNAASDIALLTGIGEVVRGVAFVGDVGILLDCVGLSFVPTTLVAVARGEQAIGTLKVGEQVRAYNPKMKKMELKPILHVWINHDHDLVDLTITKLTHGKPASEVLHTNKKHPFLTVEKGFLPVGQMKLGMHVVEANGHVGVISAWTIVPGVKTMYNLEVAQDHTYTVGVGQWVVHNCSFNYDAKIAKQMTKRGWTDTTVQEAVDDPSLTFKWRDTRNNPLTGVPNDDPASVFYHKNGGYVVRNDITKNIVQVSNRNDPGWTAPWDPLIP